MTTVCGMWDVYTYIQTKGNILVNGMKTEEIQVKTMHMEINVKMYSLYSHKCIYWHLHGFDFFSAEVLSMKMIIIYEHRHCALPMLYTYDDRWYICRKATNSMKPSLKNWKKITD